MLVSIHIPYLFGIRYLTDGKLIALYKAIKWLWCGMMRNLLVNAKFGAIFQLSYKSFVLSFKTIIFNAFSIVTP